MKKIGVLLISLLLIFSFASCGSDKDDDTFASSAAASLETEKVGFGRRVSSKHSY